ncbi:hypothetical protein WCE55_02325 [Luteimonas sp. MJ293]|uniref:hypothetical protein n=1 Tax=Luteimonas sp. MJ146 TaxID=3129240 RepID=UPI0031BBBE96
MVSAPLPIAPRTAARLLAGHIHDTSTVGAVVYHPQRPTSPRLASALITLVIAVLLLIAAAL